MLKCQPNQFAHFAKGARRLAEQAFIGDPKFLEALLQMPVKEGAHVGLKPHICALHFLPSDSAIHANVATQLKATCNARVRMSNEMAVVRCASKDGVGVLEEAGVVGAAPRERRAHASMS